MVSLTYTSGQRVEINGKEVIRIRPAFVKLDGPKGKSRVIWLQSDLFLEEAPQVAMLVSKELPTLVSLDAPQVGKVWFDGKKAKGPIWVRPQDRTGGIRSALEVGGSLQYVSNTPEQVETAIKTTGGALLPIRRDGIGTVEKNMDETTTSTIDVWDGALYKNQ